MSKRIYGNQALAQAMVVAADILPADDDCLTRSITTTFLCPGRIDQPLFFEVIELDGGCSSSTRNVSALQNGYIISTAHIPAQFYQPGPFFDKEQPNVLAPETLESPVDFFAAMNTPQGHIASATNPLDIHHMGGLTFIAPAKERMSRHPIQFEPRLVAPESSSKLLQRAMLGYAIDQSTFEPVMHATDTYWAHPEALITVLDHSTWWYRNLDLPDWTFAEPVSPSAQDGRGLTITEPLQKDKHIVTVSREGMVRLRNAAHAGE